MQLADESDETGALNPDATAHVPGMSIDVNGRAHTAAGVTTGGQYATQPRPEGSVRLTDLSEPTRAAALSHLVEQREALATALADDERILAGLDADLVSLTERRDRFVAMLTASRDRLDLLDRDIDAARAQPDSPAAPEPGQATAYQGPSHVDDVVVVPDHGAFHRVTEQNFPDEPYQIRVQVDRELTPGEARHLAQLVGYEWRKTGGEPLPEPYQDAPNSIVLYADSTKGRAYRRLWDFWRALPDRVRDGSPVRTTNRTGPAGTRLVEPLAGVGSVELYTD